LRERVDELDDGRLELIDAGMLRSVSAISSATFTMKAGSGSL
jgi:hypothetical protein